MFQGKMAEAEARFRKATEIMPEYTIAWLNLGNTLSAQGRFDEAIAAFRELAEMTPAFAPVYNNMANALKNTGRLDEAEATLKKAISLDPNYADAHDNLGVVYLRAGRIEDALASIRKALKMKPGSVPALNNLGLAYREQGDIPQAVETYEQALAIDAEHGEAHWNRAICWLLQGDLERGWPEYEWRWKRPDFIAIKPDFPTPAWNGEPLQGKSIFVCSEQGVGDTIQFVRYAPLLAERGARVIFGCQQELARLLKTAPGVSEIVPIGGTVSSFDSYAMLLSVPRLCGTTLQTIPAAIPYLQAEPEKAAAWAERFRDLDGLKVGLVWRGNPKHVNDHARSCSPAVFQKLLGVPGASFVSLQKGGPAGEALAGVRDLERDLTDFAETAAAIANLDLVISVDTAVAHLAGALGRPVWTLVPYAPDWRWLVGRDDSPWYPTMRLFRQSTPRDWDGVIAHVRAAVAGEVGKR
ncbi:MAG: glycosyltransferase family 41 protein [Rhodospirillales bacterium]|nr:glycosyltransferase family 41 protein [Rhodospirillales bacterium]